MIEDPHLSYADACNASSCSNLLNHLTCAVALLAQIETAWIELDEEMLGAPD